MGPARSNTYEFIGLIARLADANCGKIAPGSLLLPSSVLLAHHFRFERRLTKYVGAVHVDIEWCGGVSRSCA
jgi:hypothetical protein